MAVIYQFIELLQEKLSPALKDACSIFVFRKPSTLPRINAEEKKMGERGK